MKIDDKLMVEAIILGLVDPLNQHSSNWSVSSSRLSCADIFASKLASSWLNKIRRMRMKPSNRMGSFKFYFNHLFDYPFGGNEVPTMRAMMELISSDYDGIQPARSFTRLAQRLQNVDKATSPPSNHLGMARPSPAVWKRGPRATRRVRGAWQACRR
jgi:hypothetical protein